jgi:hypothetical protein
MGFNLDNYETVEDRLIRFWADHPGGRIATSIHHYDDNRVVFRAEIYFDAADTNPKAVGYAEEVRGASPVNKTSHVENAETSAIGRGLANCGYAPKGARPSREEMAKVQRMNAEEPMSQVENMKALAEVTRVFSGTVIDERPGAKRVKNTMDPASRPQVGKIVSLAMALNYSKEDRLDMASSHAGREIKDLSQLTKKEASELIEILMAAKP